MKSKDTLKLNLYQITLIFSMFFALLGFSYNVWRMEVSEENSNIRMACFEMLLELSSLEQLIYVAHYDGDEKTASPRKGWVKVALIADLSVLTSASVTKQSLILKEVWSQHWQLMLDNESSVVEIVNAIDDVRAEIKQTLHLLN
ncbi:MAG: hypothetical protein OQK09_02785 [Colwellia sp.]|nr:hypothetical protein [Colwellia sp.]MCW8863621.1 hypothetical protein [Colwellia sp.]MCW9080411.1 hypothetical protein [Colwellia sp.]